MEYTDEYIVKKEDLTAIADSIREKTGTTDLITVESMPSKVNEVYEKGKAEGGDPEQAYNQGVADGKQAREQVFWENYLYQMKYYGDYLFAGQGWIKSIMTPNVDIKPVRANQMFALSGFKGDLAQHFEDLGITLDFSNCTMTSQIFANANGITRIGVLNFTKAVSTSNNGNWCTGARVLETIDKLIVSENTYLTGSDFYNCDKLKHITIEGTIGKKIAFTQSSLLTAESILSVIRALKRFATTDTGYLKNTLTLNANSWTTINNAYPNGTEDIPLTEGETWQDYVLSIGWNV